MGRKERVSRWAAEAGQRRTREKSLRGTGSVGYSEQGWCSEKEGAGKKEAQLRSGPASRSRPISSRGLGSRAPGRAGNPGAGPPVQSPSPNPVPGEEGWFGEGPLPDDVGSGGGAGRDSPVDTELQVPHAGGDPGIAPAATPHPARDRPPPASALGSAGPAGTQRLPRAPCPLSDPPIQAARHLTCLSRLASWSWVLPTQTAASSSSSPSPRRCRGSSGRWTAG